MWPLLILAVVAFGLSLIATRHGAGIEPDSTEYLGVAHNLRAGRGLTIPFSRPSVPLSPSRGVEVYGKVPYTDEPPVYPAVLAVASRVFGSDDIGARLVNAICFAGAIGLAGFLALRATKSTTVAVLVQLVLVVGPAASPLGSLHENWLTMSGIVLAESLAAVLVLGALSLLMLAFDGRGWAFALAVAVATAAANTRWVGMSVVVAGATAIVLWPRWTARTRAVRASIFIAVPAGLALAIVRWNNARLGAGSWRRFAFHPYAENAALVRKIFSGWFAPGHTPSTLQLVVIVLAVVLATYATVRAVRALRSGGEEPPPWAIVRVGLAALVVATFAIVIGSSVFLDAGLTFDARQFHTALPALYILVFAGVLELPRVGARAVVALAVAVAAVGAGTAIRVVRDGHGYSEADVTNTALGRAVRELPAGTFIFSTRADKVYRMSGRPALLVPVTRDSSTDTPNKNLAGEICQMGDILLAKHGVIVFFPYLFDAVAHETQVDQLLGLRTMIDTPDGTVATVTRPCAAGAATASH